MPVFFKQKVNFYLCAALFGIITIWVGLYFMGNRALALDNKYIASQQNPDNSGF